MALAFTQIPAVHENSVTEVMSHFWFEKTFRHFTATGNGISIADEIPKRCG